MSAASTGVGVDRDLPASARHRHRVDAAVVAAVEPDGHPQQAGEHPNGLAVGCIEVHELGVARLGRALAVVASDEGDELDLGIGEPDELGVADDVVRVQVVLGVRDHQADVRQESSSLQQVATRLVEAVDVAAGVEQLDGQTGHVFAVGGVVVAAGRQVAHRSESHVAERVELEPPVTLDRVEEHALAQGVVAEREALDVEHLGDSLEDQRAGEDDVRPRRVEARQLPSGSDRRTLRESHQRVVELLGIELEAVVRAQLRLVGNAACTIRAIVSAVPDDAIATAKPSSSISRSTMPSAWIARTSDTTPRRSGAARDPPKKRSVRRTAPSLNERANSVSPASADEQFGRTAADVDEEQALVERGHGLQHAEVDEAASSTPEMTSISTPASRAAARNSSALAASRVALVATARSGAPALSAIWRIRRRAATARAIASGLICFISPPPWPRRTMSFWRVSTSKPSSPTRRATTRWNELVPMSRAASVSPCCTVSRRCGCCTRRCRRTRRRGRRRSSRTRCRSRCRRHWCRRRRAPSAPPRRGRLPRSWPPADGWRRG